MKMLPSLEEIMAAAESGDYVGFCQSCGAEEVFGAEELIIMEVP